jgi:hypothetical protein
LPLQASCLAAVVDGAASAPTLSRGSRRAERKLVTLYILGGGIGCDDGVKSTSQILFRNTWQHRVYIINNHIHFGRQAGSAFGTRPILL